MKKEDPVCHVLNKKVVFFLGVIESITQARVLITFLYICMSHLHVQLHNPLLFFYCVFMLGWQNDDEKKEEDINSFLLINHR